MRSRPASSVLALRAPRSLAQQIAAAIQGTLLDAATLKPVPAALVVAVRSGAPPFTGNTRCGGDGAFRIQRLAAGQYSLCVQVSGERYFDPCQWNDNPVTVSVVSGQVTAAGSIKLTAASVLIVQIQDPRQALSSTTADGRNPDLSVGVWGSNGFYYPAHAAGHGLVASYRLAVPRDIPLQFSIASHDLKLGDSSAAPLAANASQQAFQHATGDAHPKSFAFTVLGLLP